MKEKRSFAEKIVELFYPFVEAAVYLPRKQHPEVLLNPLSKKSLSLDEVKHLTSPFIRILDDGRKVKGTVIPLDEGYIVVTFDTSPFSQIQEQIATLVGTLEKEEEKIPGIAQIRQCIEEYLQREQITIGAATRTQKQEIVLKLYQTGLFQFKEASNVIAEILQTSRATIYNYLAWAKTLRRITIHQVDAFTDQPFGGNPAGVVLDARFLDDDTMRKITRAMNLSETAFVMPSGSEDFKLRYFTPTGHEILFCGHSTVGALFMIAKEGRFGIKEPGTHSLSVETNIGSIPMEIVIDETGPIIVAYDAPPIKLAETSYKPQTICKLLGIEPSSVDTSRPIMIEKTNKDLFITLKSLKDLEKLTPESRALAVFSEKEGIIAICVLSTETFDPAHQVHTRVFCPAVGIPEDPFTGSMLGGLAAYLHQTNLIPKSMKTFIAEQGHFLNRPGKVEIQFTEIKGNYTAKIFARAVHFFSTEVNLI